MNVIHVFQDGNKLERMRRIAERKGEKGGKEKDLARRRREERQEIEMLKVRYGERQSKRKEKSNK